MFEMLFDSNGCPPRWRNGIYSFHHYHSNAHEVLGIANGNARVQLGGPHGLAVAVAAGDCVLLPLAPGIAIWTQAPIFLSSVPIRRDRIGTCDGTRCRTLNASSWRRCRFPRPIPLRALEVHF